MAIIKSVRHESNYVQIYKVCLNDSRLSWKAKGFHSYIMGLPPDWVLRVSDLKNRSSDGRDSAYGAISELMKFGYMERQSKRGSDGRALGVEYTCYETPQERLIGQAEKPEAATPDPVEPPHTKDTVLLNKHISTTDEVIETLECRTPRLKKETLFAACRLWDAKLGGVVAVGRAGRALKRLIGRFDDQTILRCLEDYLKATEPKFCSLERWVDTFGQYLPKKDNRVVVNPYEMTE